MIQWGSQPPQPNFASVGRSGYVNGAKLTRRAAFVMNFTEPNSILCEEIEKWDINYPTPGWFIENTPQVEVSKQISATPVKTRLQNQFISNDKQCYHIQPTIQK
jgi:hypothetical protein